MSIVRLQVPVLIMILAATAVPVAFRPLQTAELQPFSTDAFDFVANIAIFLPVGIVLAGLGPVRAVMVAALLSIFAQASQLMMLYRVPFPGRCCEQRPGGNTGSDGRCSLQGKTSIRGHQASWNNCRCMCLADFRGFDDIQRRAKSDNSGNRNP